VALAALLGAKQYGALAALPLWSSRRLPWRVAAAAIALALATCLPFLLWDAPALWAGVVRHHLDVPLRVNSLSVPASLAAHGGWQLPGGVGFAAALAAALVTSRRPVPLGQAMLGGAAVVLAFFLFSKTGHLNYYWFVGSLLPMTLAAASVDRDGDSCAAGNGLGHANDGQQYYSQPHGGGI
jgi:hypothetical protein